MNTLLNDKQDEILPFEEPYEYFNLSYKELCEYLRKKYGPVNADYMIFTSTSCYRNPKIAYPKPGLVVHHVDENIIAELSHPERAFYFGPAYQSASRLVYATDVEHLALHYRIFMEDMWSDLGWGGIVRHGVGKSLLKEETTKKIYIQVLKNMTGRGSDLTRDEIGNYLNKIETDGLCTEHMDRRFSRLSTQSLIADNLREFDKGCTELTLEDVLTFYDSIGFKNCGRIKQYNKFYVLNNDGVVALAVVNRQGIISLVDGGFPTLTPYADIQKLYNNLCDIYNSYSIYINKINSVLTIVSDCVKAAGGFGFIHGLIVDYDMEKHIMLAPDVITRDVKVIPYYSTEADWRMDKTITIQPFSKLLPCNKENRFLPQLTTQLSIPLSLKPYENQSISLLKTKTQGNKIFDSLRELHDHTSRVVMALQRAVEFKQITRYCKDFIIDTSEEYTNGDRTAIGYENIIEQICFKDRKNESKTLQK